MELTTGTALQGGKYLVKEVLGQGLSKTLKVVQSPLNRAMVLKTINPHQRVPIDVAHLRQSLIEEAHQLARCQHPGFVSPLDLFEENGLPFVVMDYVQGASLAHVVNTQGILSEQQALQHIRQIGSALSALHRQGLVHQDVKPQNLIRPTGADFVVLVDYGFAQRSMLRALDAAGALPLREFAAPELVRSRNNSNGSDRLTPASDIYALAASLYFLVTGQKPTTALLRNYSPLVSPRQLQPDLSVGLEKAILAGMALEAGDRPQTVAAWFSLLPAEHQPMSSGSELPSLPAPGVAASVTLPPQPAMPSSPNSPPTNGIVPAPISQNGTQKTSPPRAATQVLTPKSASATKKQPRRTKHWLPRRAMVASGLIAGLTSLGVGLSLRMSGATGPGSSIFHTEQAFPPLPNFPIQSRAVKTSIDEPAVTPEVTKPAPAAVELTPPVSDRLPSESWQRRPEVVPQPRSVAPPPAAPEVPVTPPAYEEPAPVAPPPAPIPQASPVPISPSVEPPPAPPPAPPLPSASEPAPLN